MKYIYIQVVKELLIAGANYDLTDSAGWTPLHIATYLNRKDICNLLNEYGADKYIANREN